MKLEALGRGVKGRGIFFPCILPQQSVSIAAIDRLELFAEEGRWINVELPSLADVAELSGLKRKHVVLPPPSKAHIGVASAILKCIDETGHAALRNETTIGEIRTFEHSPSAWEVGGELRRFLLAFKESLVQRSIKSDHAVFVCKAFEEILSNAQEHSRSKERSIATYEVRAGWWMFSVTDFGIGIAERLRENRRYASLLDLDAVAQALEHGTSTFDGEGRGFGFTTVFSALANRNAKLRIRSGRALVTLTGIVHGTGELERHAKPLRIGAHVRAGAKIA